MIKEGIIARQLQKAVGIPIFPRCTVQMLHMVRLLGVWVEVGGVGVKNALLNLTEKDMYMKGPPFIMCTVDKPCSPTKILY